MGKKTKFDVVVCHKESGEEYRHHILAVDASRAGAVAIENARRALDLTMAERIYGTFDVISCLAAPSPP